MVDRTDGATPETGLVFAGAEIQLSVNGNPFVNFAGVVTELGGGAYIYTFDPTELTTLGRLTLKIDDPAARVVLLDFQVVTAGAFYADLYRGRLYWSEGSGPGDVPGENGTIDNPVGDLASVVSLAEKLGIRHVVASGDLVWDADATDLLIEGVSALVDVVKIDFGVGGFDANDTVFDGVQLLGQIDSARSLFRRCTIGDVTDPLILNAALFFEDCFFFKVRFGPGGKFTVGGVIGSRCKSFAAHSLADLSGPGQATFDFDGNPGIVLLWEYSGLANFSNVDVGTTFAAAEIMFASGQFAADATCVSGRVLLSGVGQTIFDESALDINDSGLIDEAGLGRYVLIDQRVYEQDGSGFLQTSARRTTFFSRADFAAAVPDTGPGPGTQQPGAIKTQRVTSTRNPSAQQQPTDFKVDTE
jgi:hypothetical protein